MTDTTDTPARLTFAERQKEAALAEVRERNEERRQIENIVLGDNDRRRRVTEVIRLGDDYLAQVANKDESWTFVVGGKASNWYHKRQEDAILHLIATRYEPNPNNSGDAAFYAGRVLGRPDSDDN